MSHENVELVRKAIDALNRGDLDAWLGFLSPDVAWEALRDVPGLGDVYHGRAEVREWIEGFFELAESGVHRRWSGSRRDSSQAVKSSGPGMRPSKPAGCRSTAAATAVDEKRDDSV